MSKKEKLGSAIVFIDGNNFYHNVKGIRVKPSDIDFYKLSEFVCDFFGFKRKKSIYYNSVPSIEDGKELYHKHVEFLNGLRILPKFEVKTRKLQKTSTKELLAEKEEIIDNLGLCKICRPLVQINCYDCIGNVKKREKGVDVMMAVDVIEAAIRSRCDACILLSGDADFVPAMQLVKQERVKVFSAFIARGYSFELRQKFKFLIIDRNDIINDCLKD